MSTAYITHPICLKHDMGYGHPESPERLRAIEQELRVAGLFSLLRYYEAPLASHEQLARVHSGHYLHAIETVAPQHGLISIDSDTLMNPYTLEAAKRAAGAVVLATDLVISGQVENAFCSIRPRVIMQHAKKQWVFAFLTMLQWVLRTLLALHGLARIAILDFDVHHGNGTEAIFKHEARVMLCSTFQHPFYPYSGADSGSDYIINTPLPAGTTGQAFRAAVLTHWIPALESFKPEMIYISAGFDAHREDEMANLNLVETDYIWITEQIMVIAEKYAQKRIVSVLEGGYELDSLARSVAAHVRVLSAITESPAD